MIIWEIVQFQFCRSGTKASELGGNERKSSTVYILPGLACEERPRKDGTAKFHVIHSFYNSFSGADTT
jgi:hypothetical protein